MPSYILMRDGICSQHDVYSRGSRRRRQPEAPNHWRGGPRATTNGGRERFSQHQPAEATWVGQGFDDPLAVRGTWRSAPASLSTATWATDLPARPLSTRRSTRSTAKIKKGGLGRPRRTNHECYLRTSGDFVNRRVGDLISLKLRSSLDDLSKRLQLFWIARAAVGFRVLFRLPEADCERFRSARNDERHFVLEALLLSKHGKDFLFKRLGELRGAVGL